MSLLIDTRRYKSTKRRLVFRERMWRSQPMTEINHQRAEELELIHTVLCGPTKEKSKDRAKYFFGSL